MADDFLPHEPQTLPEKKSSTGKTLLVWFVLIAFFVLIYSMFDKSDDHTIPSRHVESEGHSTLLLMMVGVVAFCSPFAFIMWMLRDHRSSNMLLKPGLQAIADANHRRGAELFGEVVATNKGKPALLAVAAYNRGYALLHAGDFEGAISVLVGVERSKALPLTGLSELAPIEIARAFAVAGDLARANAWLETARKRQRGQVDPVTNEARLTALAALVLCREGKFEEALRLYEQSWTRLESQMPVRSMHEVWLLRAYATAMSTGPRESGTGDVWMSLLRSTRPVTIDWLVVRWPELRTFAVTHGLPVGEASARPDVSVSESP